MPGKCVTIIVFRSKISVLKNLPREVIFHLKYFTSSDDESLSEEDVPKETFKIYSNPLFEFDDDFTSSDVNPLFNEVLEDVESKDSFDFKLAEPTLLISPLSDANKDECFDPGGDEINAFLDLDISTEIENDFHDSEGDIIFLEKLLINNTFPNLPSEDCPNFEDSRARCFVHRSFALQSFTCLFRESDILNLID
ncbi:hypothetical protein Tco_1069941 [Tanacetum coccineum]|uniref:Reverse transcriptase domain-containing protein n=1 Tax=Tanacetum coccineum TaxID=301880 RepID=A0ABQ5HK80_9ASTR